MFLEYLFELNEEYETNEKYGAYDLTDKFVVMLIGLLMIGSAATSYKYFINSPLTCFAVNNPTGENFNEFATNYIWAAGSIPESVNNQSIIENIHQWESALKHQGIHYYQWIPLILLLQSLTLLFCRYLWQSTASTNVSHNLHKLLLNCSATPSTADHNDIKKLSSNLLSVINKNYSSKKLKIKIQNKLSCFGFSRTLKNWICSNYIAYKILLICVCICQAIIINLIFDITPLDLFQIMVRSDNSYIRNFPTSVIGFVPDVAVLGSYNSYTVNCILPINLINEILFTLLQPLLICVAFINIPSLISWIIDIATQYYRIDFIKKYLPESESESEKFSTDVQIFVDNYLKWDGVFVLKMIKKNCDNHLVREIINELWRTFHEEIDCREIDAIPVDFLSSSDQIYTYLNTYIKTDGVVIIDPWITSEIISESGLLFDCVDLDLHKVKSAHLILAPVNIVNKCWMLFVYDVQSGSSYILDPSQLPFEKNMVTKFGFLFTEYLNKLSGKQNICYEFNENVPRVKQSTYDDSGPIVCGYAVNLVNDVPLLDPINVFKIRNIFKIVLIITKRWLNNNLV